MSNREFWNKRYTLGYLDALYDFAHWKDGVMFVGTSERHYQDVRREIEAKALCLNQDESISYIAVDVKEEKPSIMGWYNIVGDESVKPKHCGRVWFNGKEFEFGKSQITFSDLLNNHTTLYWMKQI